MKGMLEHQGGVSVAWRLGWHRVPGSISRVSPKLELPLAATNVGGMRAGGMGACPASQARGSGFA